MTKIHNSVKELIDTDFYEVPAEISETEALIYDWVAKVYGKNEAANPSWDIHRLAKHLDDMKELLNNTKSEYEPTNTVKYEL